MFFPVACSRWLLLFLALLLGQPCWAAELRLYTEENPPLNSYSEGEVGGFSTEVIKGLAARTGDTVHIELGPWTRGYAKAQRDANTGIFTTARIPAREGQFQWVGPLTQTNDRFYTRKVAGIRINNLDEAAQAGRLVLPRQWYTYEYLQAKGLRNIYTVTGPDKMMQMFSLGRSDMLALSELALPEMLAMVGMTQDEVEPQFVFLQHQSFLAFSLTTDEQIVKRWQTALDESKRDGHFIAVFRRWFPGKPIPDELLQVMDDG
jgi:polar amino acid transport system substrate-binding protein